MPPLPEWISGNSSDMTLKGFWTLVIIIVFWLLRRWLLILAIQRITDPKRRYNLQRNSAYFTFFLAFVTIGFIWLENASQIATYLGLVSAGIAVAIREPLVNLIGWAYIIWKRPFNIGDRIQIGSIAGDIIDIDPFQIVMMEIGNWVQADQSTGRIIHIPNSKVLVESLANYTEEFNYIWNEISLTITFESDWQKAKNLLQVIANQNSAPIEEAEPEMLASERHKYYYFYTHLTPTVYTAIRESGVNLTIRYLCKPRNRRNSEQPIWENILRTFDQHTDIQLAYPTQRNIVNLRPKVAETSPDTHKNQEIDPSEESSHP